MAKGFEPWIAVKVGVRKNRKLAGLPDDTARYGWLAGVLAEAKLQRPGGRFDSRGQLEEAIGRFAPYVDKYVAAGLLEVAGRLCPSCRKVWKALPVGSYVVHDWRAHQRDPFAQARVEEWRRERSDELENDVDTTDVRRTYDVDTTDERPEYESDSRDERPTNEFDSPDVTVDSRARGKTVDTGQETEGTRDTGDSPQPPSQAGGRSRAKGTSPRQVAQADADRAAAEKRARSWRANQRRLASYRGAITDAELLDMNRRDAALEEIPDWAEHQAQLRAEAEAQSPLAAAVAGPIEAAS